MADLREYNLVEIKAAYLKASIVAKVVEAEPRVLLTFLNINLFNKETPFTAYLPVGEEITLGLEFESPYGLLYERKSFTVRKGKPQVIEFTFPGKSTSPTPPEPPEYDESGYIHGHVTDADGNPVVGVFVQLEGGNLQWYNAATDKAGYYRINIGNLKGEFRISAKKPGYKTKIKRIQRAREDKYQICNFKLNPAEEAPAPTGSTTPTTGAPATGPSTTTDRIYGYVNDAKTNAPLAGATITSPSHGFSTTTRADGYYEVLNTGAEGDVDIVAECNNYTRETVTKNKPKRHSGIKVDFKLNRTKPLPVPNRVAASLGVNFSRLVGSLTAVILGMVVSALLGNPFFFFGFLLIGASIIMPNTEDMRTVQNLMRQIRTNNSVRISNIQNSNLPDSEKIRQIKELVETEERSLKIENLIQNRMERTDRFRVNIALVFKHLFKALAAISFVVALINTGIPFSNILALIAAFIGYFTIGGYRMPIPQQQAAPAGGTPAAAP